MRLRVCFLGLLVLPIIVFGASTVYAKNITEKYDYYHTKFDELSVFRYTYAVPLQKTNQSVAKFSTFALESSSINIILSDDATGGDCESVGIWDESIKTCTLSSDFTGTIQITSNDITLDGSGHVLDGFNSDTGIYISDVNNITVKNLNITGFNGAIYINNSDNNRFLDDSLNQNNNGVIMFDSNNNYFNNLNISGSSQGILVFNSNNNVFSDLNIIDFSSDGFLMFDSRENVLSNLNLSGVGDGILLFNSVKNTIEDFLSNGFISSMVVLYDSSENKLIRLHIVGIEDGLQFYNSDKNIVRNNTLSDLTNFGISIYNSIDNIIYNNSFENNYVDINSYGSDSIYDMPLPFGGNHWSTFDEVGEGCLNGDTDNFCDDAYTFQTADVSNITDDHPWISAGPWPDGEPPLLPNHNPVIIIPGITGTYLYKNYGDNGEIWPDVNNLIRSITDNFLDDLSLLLDGTEDPSFPIKVGDIIREEQGQHVFDGLITELENAGYVENEDLFVFPYDWRLKNSDIVDSLTTKIDIVRSITGADKVDIIAHSMGGLITKGYINQRGGDKVDKIIFLGTPQLGAPKAFKALMYGDDMGFRTFFNLLPILSSNRMKVISQNMPSVYELLPSEKYIDENGGYFTNALDENNPVTLDYIGTKNFMLADGRNPLMFPFAEDLHSEIDDLDFGNTKVYNFVGCGSYTVTRMQVEKKSFIGINFGQKHKIKYGNGDETVPLVSADAVSANNTFYVKDATHGSLPSTDGVKETVTSILSGEDPEEYENILSSPCNLPSGKELEMHSPMDMNIYDEFGNHAGPDGNGNIEINIPGAQYDTIGDEKFAFLPDGVNYRIALQATGTGTYSFAISSQNEDEEITDVEEWNAVFIPSKKTEGEIMIGPSYPIEQYVLRVDNDGNGKFESTIKPSQAPTFSSYLALLREAIDALEVKPAVKKLLLHKLDIIEKSFVHKNQDKRLEKLIKFAHDIEKHHGNFKKLKLEDRYKILDFIKKLLYEFN